MDNPPRRRGRPTKPPKPGERVMLGLRVTPDIKLKLEAAAVESGRSLSQEAELRLQQSFDREYISPEAVDTLLKALRVELTPYGIFKRKILRAWMKERK